MFLKERNISDLQSFAAPFVHNPAYRSPVVGTIDIDGIEASTIIESIKILDQNIPPRFFIEKVES